jgi:hypothetical protein
MKVSTSQANGFSVGSAVTSAERAFGDVTGKAGFDAGLGGGVQSLTGLHHVHRNQAKRDPDGHVQAEQRKRAAGQRP